MALESNLKAMADHFVHILELNKTAIVDDKNEFAFKSVVYGEPRVIHKWPCISVQPLNKERDFATTRQFTITFTIEIIIYHGTVQKTTENQREVHAKAEAIEAFLNGDHKWNYIDASDHDKDKVVWGQSVRLDHPVVVAERGELWSASRIVMQAESREYF